jgi:hypothetical protein
MMDMNDMMNHCADVMGGGMMGGGVVFVLLLVVLFLVWVIGLGVVGALIFWGVRRFSRPHA